MNTSTPNQPRPLDLSTVKAGDTVTLERDTALARDVVDRIDTYPQGGYSIVLAETTQAYLTLTGWTLTDHQPTPEPALPTTNGSVVQANETGIWAFRIQGAWIDANGFHIRPNDWRDGWTLVRDAGTVRRYCKGCGKELDSSATARAQYCVQFKPDGSRDQRCKNMYHSITKASREILA